MSYSTPSCCLMVFVIAGLIGWIDPAAAESELAPALLAKASAFHQADEAYRRSLCAGAETDRAQAKTALDSAQTALQDQIASEVTASRLVQKALEVASEAGEAADKASVAAGASDQDKAAAAAKFEAAKKELREVAVREKAWVEAQLTQATGVKLAAVDACPDRPTTAAKHEAAVKPKQRRAHVQAQPARAAAQSSAAPAVNIGVGGGGGSISFSGSAGSISFGR